MRPLGELTRPTPLRPDGTGGGWLGARHFELVHSAKVVGPRLRPPTDAGGPADAPASFPDPSEPPDGCDYLVSVLREGWESGGSLARIRLTHTTPDVGPLEAIITGPPEPQMVRLRSGEVSHFREVRPVPIDLEIRRAGQSEGVRALPAFDLEPASSYTIIIAGCGVIAPEVIEWSEGQENVE